MVLARITPVVRVRVYPVTQHNHATQLLDIENPPHGTEQLSLGSGERVSRPPHEPPQSTTGNPDEKI